MKLVQAFGLILICFSAASVAREAQNAELTRPQIKETECLLSEQGFWTGPIDGIFEAGSRSALELKSVKRQKTTAKIDSLVTVSVAANSSAKRT